jgi:hypothetical protein
MLRGAQVEALLFSAVSKHGATLFDIPAARNYTNASKTGAGRFLPFAPVIAPIW